MACGTSRARVQGPQALQSKKPKIVLQPGEACALHRGPILAFKWRQNKLKMCTWWQCYTTQLKHSLVAWREVQATPYINLQLSLNTLNKWEVLTWVTSWWTTTTSCAVVANGGGNCGSIYSMWSYSMVMFWIEHLDTRITWVTMNTGTCSLVPFWSILKFHNPLQPVGQPNDIRNAHWPERLPKSHKNNQTKLESVSSAT